MCARAWLQWHALGSGMSGYSGVLFGGLDGIKRYLRRCQILHLLRSSAGLIITELSLNYITTVPSKPSNTECVRASARVIHLQRQG